MLDKPTEYYIIENSKGEVLGGFDFMLGRATLQFMVKTFQEAKNMAGYGDRIVKVTLTLVKRYEEGAETT